MDEVSREFRQRLGLGAFVVVADLGQGSAATLVAVCSEGVDCVVAERLWRGTANATLACAGRHKRTARNLVLTASAPALT